MDIDHTEGRGKSHQLTRYPPLNSKKVNLAEICDKAAVTKISVKYIAKKNGLPKSLLKNNGFALVKCSIKKESVIAVDINSTNLHHNKCFSDTNLVGKNIEFCLVYINVLI